MLHYFVSSAAVALFLAGVVTPQPSRAEPSTPIGAWRTIDDNTRQPKAIVRIVNRGGKLYGTVEASLIADPPHKTCEGCTDDRKGQPILGMEIIRDLAHDGDEWKGGTILDPETGKVYKCQISLRDNGQKLAVRGFLGISLFGRTQTWERTE